MSITDGQSANAAVTNAAFVSKTANSTMVGALTLNKPSGSGSSVADVQSTINAILADVADPVSLTTEVSGTLPIANGGTNNGSLAVTAGGALYTDGSKIINLGAGSTGQVLTSQGSSSPIWLTPSVAGASVVTSVKTGTYAILNTDGTVQVNASGGAFTATLPTAVGISGTKIKIKKVVADTTFTTVTIATTSSQTIDGLTSFPLTNGWIEVQSDNANWIIVDKNYKTRAIVGGTPASASSGNPIIFPTVQLDTHGAYNSTTGRYTVPTSEAGDYEITLFNQSTNNTAYEVYKGAASNRLIAFGTGGNVWGSIVIPGLVAGDIIDVRPGGAGTGTNFSGGSISFVKL